ncbi:DUF2520 domain-containing protein [candidate division WOR-3 bacterium]|nr:DUF2520 domain-containing protein [candidate division WOR-3 bacterium]
MSSISEKRIGIVGPGKVGATLAYAFRQRGFAVSVKAKKNLKPSTRRSLRFLGIKVFSESQRFMSNSDIIFICTREKDIFPAYGEIEGFLTKNHFLAHTSASFAARGNLKGMPVFHPYRSFPDAENDFKALEGVLFGISGKGDLRILFKLAKKLGGKPAEIPEKMLPLYHASAVILVEGAVKTVAKASMMLEMTGFEKNQAKEICTDFALKMQKNIQKYGIEASETGPVSRKSQEIIDRHLKEIKKLFPECLQLYKALVQK